MNLSLSCLVTLKKKREKNENGRANVRIPEGGNTEKLKGEKVASAQNKKKKIGGE